MADPRRIQTSGCDRARNELHPLTVQPLSRPIYGQYWFKVKTYPNSKKYLLAWLENVYGGDALHRPERLTNPPPFQWRGGTRVSAYFSNEEEFYKCAKSNLMFLEQAQVPYNQKQVDMWCEDSSLTLLHNLFKGRYRFRIEYRGGGLKKAGPIKHALKKLENGNYVLGEHYDFSRGWGVDTLYILDRDLALMIKLTDQTGVRSWEKVITYTELEN